VLTCCSVKFGGRHALAWAIALMVGGLTPAFAQETAADAAAAPATPPAADSFFLWTDTSVSVLPWGTGFEVDPSEQSTITLEHAHESKVGDLFMFVDFTRMHGAPAGLDKDTWYGEFGPRLSFGKLSGKDLSHTFFKRSLFEIKDVLLALQYERGEDPDVAEAALVGLGLNLDVREAGLLGGLGKFNYVQLNIYGRAELTEGTEHGFRDMQITMVASYPFTVGGSDWLLDGYYDWVLGLGSEQWSYHLNPQLTVDLGELAGYAPRKFYAGVEIDLWWNKYQIPNSSGFDTHQQAASLLFKYHF